MATPRKGYTVNGERVPSVTTILSRFKESGALMHWAFEQGRSGASHLHEKSQEAASIGTAAHEAIESYLNGEDPVIPIRKAFGSDLDKAKRAKVAFNQFLEWQDNTNTEFLTKHQEVSLLSTEYRFGGTPDAFGIVNGRVALIDWKTSGGIYTDYILQLAAYGELADNGVVADTLQPLGLRGPIEEYHICRFSKDHGDFEHRKFTDLSQAWEQFKLLRKAYDIDKELKKRVR